MAKVGQICLTLSMANDGKLWLATKHPQNTLPEVKIHTWRLKVEQW